ncbi:MAG: hypothetical protein RBT71_04215 [Flavobacteriales bacterium]|jgi:hypothetical protein|nr:hypothetical protein [Flavobacteriales bacterium]
MGSAVFDERYGRILRSREQGYEELTDFLGRGRDLGALVRTGLMRRREENTEFQRYHGYVPTEAAGELLLFIPDKELVLVKPGCSLRLRRAMAKDPMPEAPFKPTYTEPTGEQFAAARQMRENAGRDVWRLQRAEALLKHLHQGYMDLRMFTKRTGTGEGTLLDRELLTAAEARHAHALHVAPTEEGARYLLVADPWELILVRPGMELPLFARCEPEQAAYWCGLP